MVSRSPFIASTILLLTVYSNLAAGQSPPPTILEVELDNVVEYQTDISDLSRFGTNPDITRASPPKNFSTSYAIGDIVRVNGQPVKGTVAWTAHGLGLSPTAL